MTKTKKSALYVVSMVISAVILLCAIAVFTVTLIARSQNKEASFFGYSFAIVQTDSMDPEIPVNSFILIKNCEISEELLGENVVFVSQSGTLAGNRIVHQVVDVEVVDGEIYLTTQGVKEGAPVDTDKVTAENFVGICVYHSYALGVVVSFISAYGVPIVILLIAVPLIYSCVKRVIRAAKDVKEEDEEDEAEDKAESSEISENGGQSESEAATEKDG